MLNRDVFTTDPDKYPLSNNGVATLSFPASADQLAVLRSELASFVCEGAYADGLVRIIEGFCAANASGTVVPAVWLSGFFGSGKSHLAAMLGALWANQPFADGATPESQIVGLPAEVRAALAELRTIAKRVGGTLVIGGTLGRGSNDPARAVAELVLRGVGLPDDPRTAEVALWLAREGILEAVRAALGDAFDNEIRIFALSPRFAAAILAEKPGLASDADAMVDRLAAQFPASDGSAMSVQAMERLVGEALLLGRSELPLTLIILDEVQQFLDHRRDETLKLQNIAERLSSTFKGRLMLVATGQQALTQVDNLQKVLARFSLTVQLRDTDIDAVIRKTVLAKRPENLPALNAMLDRASGELSRQLAGARLRHTAADAAIAPLDWPLLPARRRLWELMLRELDSTRLRSNLRGQLRITLEAARAYADRPLGTSVPADYLYRTIASDAVNADVLPRETFERIEKLQGGPNPLTARVLSLVFLLAKIARSAESHGVRATADTIADLLIEDLGDDHRLRADVPLALQRLAEDGAVIDTGSGWRLQTKESAEWDRQFRSEERHRAQDTSETTRLRRELLNAALEKLFAEASSIAQGASKERRIVRRIGTDDAVPSGGAIIVRQHSGYDTSLKDTEAAIARAPVEDATIHLLIPAEEDKALQAELRTRAAAEAVLAARGPASSDDGKQAREAMQARFDNADREARRIIGLAATNTRVMLAGGAEQEGAPAAALKAAAERAAQRLYDKFDAGDHVNWGAALRAAQVRDPQALKKIGFDGSPDQHPVGKAIMASIGPGKKGAAIRAALEAPPFGWNSDAINTLLLLLSREHLTVKDASGQPVADLAALSLQNIGTSSFQTEMAVVSTPDRLRIRKLLVAADIAFQPSREIDALPDLFKRLETLAAGAGGDAPCPAAAIVPGLDEVREAAGNARLVAVAARSEAWGAAIPQWIAAVKAIAARRPAFALLRTLTQQGAGDQASGLRAIVEQRTLLAEVDPVAPLLAAATTALRTRLNAVAARWQAAWESAEEALHADANWAKLDAEQRRSLRADFHLLPHDPPRVDTADAIAAALETCSLMQWEAMAQAVPSRLATVQYEAARVFAPKTQRVRLAAAVIADTDGLDAWLAASRAALLAALADGPVVPGF